MKTKLALFLLSFIMFLVISVDISSKTNTSDRSITIMMQANAEVNPKCPSGCKESGEGCYCYKFYPYLYGDMPSIQE